MRLAALAALAILAGCNDFPRARSEAEIRNIAEDVADDRARQLEARIGDLETELQAAKADSARINRFALAISDSLDRLRNTFNHNVDQSNAAKVRQLTASGACGQEWVRLTDGASVWRNRECTAKDLR